MSPVSQRLLEALDRIATAYRREGVRLFVFGSLAKTWPESHRGADLDLGFEVEREGISSREVERRLATEIEDFPTVRPVDLVDFGKVDANFRRKALRHVVELPASK